MSVLRLVYAGTHLLRCVTPRTALRGILEARMNSLPDDKGTNTRGESYNSIADLWEHELGEKNDPSWYANAGTDYWIQ